MVSWICLTFNDKKRPTLCTQSLQPLELLGNCTVGWNYKIQRSVFFQVQTGDPIQPLAQKNALQAAPSVSSNSSPKHLWRHHNHDPYPIISARLSQPTGEPTGEWKSHEIPRLILISSPRIHATTRLSLFKGALFRRNVNLCFFNISWRWNNSLVGYILHHTWSIYQNTGWWICISWRLCRRRWSWNHISFPQAVRPFGRAIPNKCDYFLVETCHMFHPKLAHSSGIGKHLLCCWKNEGFVRKGKVVFTLVLKLSKFVWSTIWKYLLTSSMLHCQVSLPESPFPLFKSF